MPIMDEAPLVEALRRGEGEVLDRVVRLYQPMLMRAARARVGDDAAADAVQDAWVGVITGISRFEGRSPLRAWLLAIVRNQAIAEHRRRRRAAPVAFSEEHLSEAALGSSPWQAWGPSAPEQAVLDRERLGAVASALADLPPRQRRVLELRDLEGASASAVCHQLSIGPGNQRVLLHRARARIRRAVADAEPARDVSATTPRG
jgi:RNA polymerase sigma-70 factor (ECF subfamily)